MSIASGSIANQVQKDFRALVQSLEARGIEFEEKTHWFYPVATVNGKRIRFSEPDMRIHKRHSSRSWPGGWMQRIERRLEEIGAFKDYDRRRASSSSTTVKTGPTMDRIHQAIPQRDEDSPDRSDRLPSDEGIIQVRTKRPYAPHSDGSFVRSPVYLKQRLPDGSERLVGIMPDYGTIKGAKQDAHLARVRELRELVRQDREMREMTNDQYAAFAVDYVQRSGGPYPGAYRGRESTKTPVERMRSNLNSLLYVKSKVPSVPMVLFWEHVLKAPFEIGVAPQEAAGEIEKEVPVEPQVEEQEEPTPLLTGSGVVLPNPFPAPWEQDRVADILLEKLEQASDLETIERLVKLIDERKMA